jgi:peptide/nickel transport system substrate-binding protein
MDEQRAQRPGSSDVLDRSLSRRDLLKGVVAFMAVGAVAPLAAACGPGQATPPAPAPAEKAAGQPGQPSAAGAPDKQAAEPRKGGTLKVAIIGEAPAFDPTFTTATITQNISWHMFEQLFSRNEKQEPVPQLIEKHDASSDGKSWTFTLRRGVPFHNDKEMTSADVVASLKRWMSMAGRGKFIAKRLETVDPKDKYTVSMTFKEPTGILPTFLAQRDVIIIPEDIANAAPKDKLAGKEQLVGTGPFRFLEHQPDRYLRLGRWDKYAALDKPPDGPAGKRVAYLDEILFIPVPEDSVRADGVGTGEYHFGETLQPDQYDTVKANPSVTPLITKPNYWYTPHFNKKEGLFTDVRLRQAVLASISMEPVMKAGWGRPDFYRLGPEIAAPETAWYNDEGKDVYDKPDPDKARALLKEAGYDGTPVRWMSTKEYFYNYNMSLPFKQAMEQVGFKVDLQVTDWATLVKRRSDSKEYDVFVTGHPSYDHPALQVYLEASWPGWWVSDEKDRIVNGILSEIDPQKQNALIRQLQATQWQEVPCIKCGEGFRLSSRRNELKGYENPPDWFFWNAWLG